MAKNMTSVKSKTPVKELVKEPVKEPVKEESESEEESENESDDDSDNESEKESENETETKEKEEKEEKEKKEKKEKPSFTQIMVDIDADRILISNNKLSIDNLEKEIKNLEKQIVIADKRITKNLVLLPKANEDAINKARKEKKKRTNTTRTGILAPLPVPSVLTKFLNIPDDSIYDRTKVMSLLSNKFKDLGLKNGQVTTLDKKTAKIFGLEEGHKIEFKQFHSFLKSIYESAENKSTEVKL